MTVRSLLFRLAAVFVVLIPLVSSGSIGARVEVRPVAVSEVADFAKQIEKIEREDAARAPVYDKAEYVASKQRLAQFNGCPSGFCPGNLLGRSSSGSSYTTVSPPASLGWTPSLNVRKNNATGVYSTDFDVTSVKPTPVYNYYVSPSGSGAASPSDNDPNTPITIDRFATLANANGGIVRGYLAGGNHYTTSGLSLSGSGLVFEPWVGQGTGAARVIKRSTGADPVWTVDGGNPNTYTTPHAIANTDVYDYSVLDSNGMPSRLTAATSIANCESTPGSFFYDSAGSKMYVRAADSRNLVGDTNMLVPTYNGTSTITVTTSTKVQTAWVKDIKFIGTFSFTQTGAFRSLFYTSGAFFIGGDTNSQSVLGPIDVYHMSPRVGGALNDGLNYHGNGAGDPRFFEYDYRGTRSGWQTGGTANNASSSHENAIGISVAGDYPGSQNRVIHDINAAKRWMAGSTVRASAASDLTSITVQAGTGSGSADTAQLWLEDCTIENSTTAGLYADTSAQINYKLTNYDLTSGGLGILAPYKVTPAGSITISAIDHKVDAVDRSSYSFTVNSMTGDIIVGFSQRTVQTISSVTIGGVTAKPIHSKSNGSDGVAFYGARGVSAGTNVTITLGGTTARMGLVVFGVSGALSLMPYQRGDSQSDPATATIGSPASGAVIGYAAGIVSAATSSWTGISSLVAAEAVEATFAHTAGASSNVGGGSISPSNDWTGTFTSGAAVFASLPAA